MQLHAGAELQPVAFVPSALGAWLLINHSAPHGCSSCTGSAQRGCLQCPRVLCSHAESLLSCQASVAVGGWGEPCSALADCKRNWLPLQVLNPCSPLRWQCGLQGSFPACFRTGVQLQGCFQPCPGVSREEDTEIPSGPVEVAVAWVTMQQELGPWCAMGRAAAAETCTSAGLGQN